MEFDREHQMSLRDGRFDGTTPEDLAALVGKWGEQPAGVPLVVHFHGGLVTAEAGLAMARALGPEYEAAGGWPLFVLWRSGWHDILSANLSRIAGRALIGVLLRRLAAWLGQSASTDLDLSAAAATLAGHDGSMGASVDALELSLRADPEFRAAIAEETPADGAAMGLGAAVLSAAARAAKVAVAVRARFAAGRDHGAHATVVEEILREFYLANAGQLLWSEMKQATSNAYGAEGDCGGTALLQALDRVWRTQPERRVVLVGHSTGAVCICHLLQSAGGLPEQARFDVALLAPACTAELFADTLDQARARIANYRCFGLSDPVERSDTLLPGVPWFYPHSLLYFVSGVCEPVADTPLVGLQRTYTADALADAPGVSAVRAFAAEMPQRALWSVCGTDGSDGLACNARHHVQLDDLETDDHGRQTTIDSLRHLIGHGF